MLDNMRSEFNSNPLKVFKTHNQQTMKPTTTNPSFSKVLNFGKAAKHSLTIITIFIINLLSEVEAQNLGVNTVGVYFGHCG